jgi:hypothetical protein
MIFGNFPPVRGIVHLIRFVIFNLTFSHCVHRSTGPETPLLISTSLKPRFTASRVDNSSRGRQLEFTGASPCFHSHRYLLPLLLPPSSACHYSTCHEEKCPSWRRDISPGDRLFNKVAEDQPQGDLIIASVIPFCFNRRFSLYP